MIFLSISRCPAEFMVDLIKKLFDPSLNLFRRTSNGHVYPSPMSNVSETNHLDLIEFSGKMLAKAIYEVCSLLFSISNCTCCLRIFYQLAMLFVAGHRFGCAVGILLP